MDANSVGPGRVSAWPRALNSRHRCRWHLMYPTSVASPMLILRSTLVVLPQLHIEIIWRSFEKTTKGSHPKPVKSESGPRREAVFHSSQEIPGGVWPR